MDFSLNILLRYHNGFSPLFITMLVTIPLYYVVFIILSRHYNHSSKSQLKDHHSPKKNHISPTNKYYDNCAIRATDLTKEYPCKLSKKDQRIMDEQKTKESMSLHRSKYNKQEYVKTAIDNITFQVNKNECFGILGKKGSGKSTLLDIISSMIPQTSGQVYFEGRELTNQKVQSLPLNYCSQNDLFWEALTTSENIEYTLKLGGYSDDQAYHYTSQYLDYFHLKKKENINAYRLNHDSKRLLCFIKTLCHPKENLILDEPTADMNPFSKHKVWDVLRELKDRPQTSILMTTRSMIEAEALCDQIAILANGQMIGMGTPEQLKRYYCEHHYILEVHSKNIKSFHRKVIEEAHLLGSNYQIEDQYWNYHKYQAYLTNGIGKVFDIMERCKSSGLITDYSFSQITLQQFFLNL